MAKNGLEACYIRPMVMRGFGAAGMVPFDSPVEVYLPCWEWGAYLGDGALEEGVDACISSWHRGTEHDPGHGEDGGQLPQRNADQDGGAGQRFRRGDRAGPDGRLSEGSGQNVFVVSRGVLYTPPFNGTLLAGITRDSVLTLANDLGIGVREQEMPRESLYAADEMFLTGTASEVTPVRSLDRIRIGNGRRGPVTETVQRRYLDIARGTAPDTHRWLTGPVR